MIKEIEPLVGIIKCRLISDQFNVRRVQKFVPVLPAMGAHRAFLECHIYTSSLFIMILLAKHNITAAAPSAYNNIIDDCEGKINKLSLSRLNRPGGPIALYALALEMIPPRKRIFACKSIQNISGLFEFHRG